jgi:hypothetical protein
MVHDPELPGETDQEAKIRQASVAAKNGKVSSLLRPSA